MFELLFLLLPVAAFYGYYMGHNASRQKQQNTKHEQNSTYLKGFDYLLNNKQEKAVDKFIAFLNSKDPTYESSLALGNFFRKRGEVDKAIALHEKMSQDETLLESDRELALLELSRDFISAGLLDRAESILLSIVDIPRQQKEAAYLLLTVYEKEQDFHKAISVFESYKEVLAPYTKHLAQYYCELSKKMILDNNQSGAVSILKKAIDVHKNGVRARLELADIYISMGKFAEAHSLVKEVSSIEPSYGILCLDRIKKCFPNSVDPKYRYALEDLVHRTNSVSAMCELVRLVAEDSGIKDAEALLYSFTKIKANLRLYSLLLELCAKEDPTSAESLMKLKSMIDAHLATVNIYTCPNCGFESLFMFWMCPSCRKWESLKPKIGIDGD